MLTIHQANALLNMAAERLYQKEFELADTRCEHYPTKPKPYKFETYRDCLRTLKTIQLKMAEINAELAEVNEKDASAQFNALAKQMGYIT